MTKTAVTAVLVTYNSARHIGLSLESLLSDPRGPEQIVVFDNASADETRDVVARFDVELMESAENLGLAAACHEAVAAARNAIVVFCNPDIVAEPGWLVPLVAALDEQGVGAAAATMELVDPPGRLNTSGGELTYFGLAWASEVGTLPDRGDQLVDIPFAPGAALAITRATWDRVGGLRSGLGTYHDDVDLGWRLHTIGLRCVRVPAARVKHDYEFSRHGHKLFLLERNRWAMLCANYRRSTLLLLAPGLAIAELGVMAIAIRDGWARSKVASWLAAWRLRDDTRKWYRRVQAERTVGDAAIIAGMSAGVEGVTQIRVPRGAQLVGRVLSGWRRLVLPLVRRGDRRRGLA